MLVEAEGFKVMAVKSDNNRINTNAFAGICGDCDLEPYVTHPCDEQRRLFFVSFCAFDEVHSQQLVKPNQSDVSISLS